MTTSDMDPIYFVVCHPGPANHFQVFVDSLTAEGKEIRVISSDLISSRFSNIESSFSLKDLSVEERAQLAETIAKTCASAKAVITDVGDTFDIELQEALEKFAPQVARFAYYDNFSLSVPGEYGIIAPKVMQKAQTILFGNANLEREELPDLADKKKIGIGYYPTKEAEEAALERTPEKRQAIYDKLVEAHPSIKKDLSVWVYFGGANSEYYDEAFPAFLTILETAIQREDLSNRLLVVHRHPRASDEGDKNKLERWLQQHQDHAHLPKIVISTLTSKEAQVVADTAFYYQTTMSPQFVLAGIPTIQIGHKTYADIPVELGLVPSVTSADMLAKACEIQDKKDVKETLMQGLGIKVNWNDILKEALKI